MEGRRTIMIYFVGFFAGTLALLFALEDYGEGEHSNDT